METEPSWPSSSGTRPKGLGSEFECGSRRPSCVKTTWRGFVKNSVLAVFVGAANAGSGWSKTSLMLNGSCERFVPFARVKAPQIDIALQILEHRINSIDDLREQAERADALSLLNVRSRGRRQNTAAMIQGFVS